MRPLLFALIAACGNALFVYGQRSAAVSANPFLFMAYAVTAGAVLFVVSTLLWQSPGNLDYAAANYPSFVISGVGFFVTFFGFYLLYSNFGASQYALYAVLSILTTSVGVGALVFREPLNTYQWVAIALAAVAIGLWTYGRSKGVA